jgi:FMN phosphatase YigB (HAD superfamily)
MAKKFVVFAGNNVLWAGTPPKLRDHAFEALCGLRSERAFILAGDPREQAEIVRSVGLEQYFISRWFCGAPDNKRDVLRMMREEVGRELGASSKEIVVVGDDPQSELFFASRLNLTTAMLVTPENAGFRFESGEPDHRITSLAELLPIVNA